MRLLLSCFSKSIFFLQPTSAPTASPTKTPLPSFEPSRPPSPQPSPFPTWRPTKVPSSSPSFLPSDSPSDSPSDQPSGVSSAPTLEGYCDPSQNTSTCFRLPEDQCPGKNPSQCGSTDPCDACPTGSVCLDDVRDGRKYCLTW